jgi:hypothetical protein
MPPTSLRRRAVNDAAVGGKPKPSHIFFAAKKGGMARSTNLPRHVSFPEGEMCMYLNLPVLLADG